MSERPNAGPPAGPFRLLKYFIISGFVVIAIVTVLLGTVLYTRSIDALLSGSKNFAKLLAENLNYNIYAGFYAPLKARSVPMDLRKWEHFGAIDSLIKDVTYGLKIDRIKIVGPDRKIMYSTEYDLIDKYEPNRKPFEKALSGESITVITRDEHSTTRWYPKWLVKTYHPLREVTGNFWMLGKIYGVIEITQDVTDQYRAVQKSVGVIIVVAVALMGFLFVMLTLIVRRGEQILFERANEQKKLEEKLQQSEKLASIGQLVAVIAHEIRNPLGIVRSSAEMLAKKAESNPERVKKLSEVIVEETIRLSAILTDFLEFARPKNIRPRRLDVTDVVERVRTNMQHEVESRGIRWLDTDLDGTDPTIIGDSDQLYQAFLNVTMNAFEAMESGDSFMVQVRPDDSQVRVDFIDSGSGIQPEDLERIFTPFFTTNKMGTGLGLSVVHNIVTAHGGDISVHSRPNEGTTISIFLPIGDSEEQN